MIDIDYEIKLDEVTLEALQDATCTDFETTPYVPVFLSLVFI